MWKLDDSQWKDDINYLKLVATSIDMYHWETLCLDTIKIAPIKNEGQATANKPDVSTAYTSSVWKLDGSQWKDDINYLNLVAGSKGMMVILCCINAWEGVLMVTLDIICFVWICMKKGNMCYHQSSRNWNDLEVAYTSRIEPDDLRCAQTKGDSNSRENCLSNL